ncbi:DUF2284 domain-containing protein|uniref:Predicted metal-binding protein n=1 Tax=Dendrosporobacter quercicolus TaxID=146817 RepID=A0A1G9VXC3_9FIRM|nr:DUF2284 domain-containing protein [Dendrosporobacter quercicolus]NSL47775.1 DUF2284 domain-containing protein [Dendrosporobacter quercicolus DSM 1736]SDM76870.1 Predicted metal-binding protein [Dendrosporobacter quercicolus]
MFNHSYLEEIFIKYGFEGFKWINPKEIIVAQWVRMKCIFGCPTKTACCPPNTPTVEICKSFLQEYDIGVIFHIPKIVTPEFRHEWSREVNLKLFELERETFIAGYEKAFAIFMDSCHICANCRKERFSCANPSKARPSPEAMAIDVVRTARQYGFPIDVLPDYSSVMNRYAFLLLE